MFPLPSVASNIELPGYFNEKVMARFRSSFAYEDSHHNVGASSSFWRSQPFIYLDIEPGRSEKIGTVWRNSHNEYSREDDLYAAPEKDAIDRQMAVLKATFTG